MLELHPAYALVNDNGDPLVFESSNFSMRAVTNLNKVKLQISLQSQWDHSLLQKSTGISLADNPNEKLETDPAVFWLAPNEWLFVSSKLDRGWLHEVTKEVLQGRNFAITDLTDRFSIIELEGESVREILMAGCSIDLDMNAFQSQQYRLSRLANLSVILCCQQSPNTFRMIVDRSEARYLWDWLSAIKV